ncbi:MAG: class I SAM-dependent methyltransferase [Rhodospirillales bacterium]
MTRGFGELFKDLVRKLASKLGLAIVRQTTLDRLVAGANAWQNPKGMADLEFAKTVKGYGVATEGPIPPDSPLHELYMIQTLPDPFITSAPEKRRLFDDLFKTDMRYPWYDPLRVVQFMWLIDIANRLSDGEYIEIGTAGGHAARYIWKLMNPGGHLYCFDTFEGFDAKEVELENKLFKKEITVGFIGVNPIEEVRHRIADGGDAANLHLVKGWFPGSFKGHEHRRFRFAHVDLDLYEPTRATLETVWPLIVPGGVMLFHDYGCSLFPGVRKAVDEFFLPRGITPFPLYDKLISAAIIKASRVE